MPVGLGALSLAIDVKQTLASYSTKPIASSNYLYLYVSMKTIITLNTVINAESLYQLMYFIIYMLQV